MTNAVILARVMICRLQFTRQTIAAAAGVDCWWFLCEENQWHEAVCSISCTDDSVLAKPLFGLYITV